MKNCHFLFNMRYLLKFVLCSVENVTFTSDLLTFEMVFYYLIVLTRKMFIVRTYTTITNFKLHKHCLTNNDIKVVSNKWKQWGGGVYMNTFCVHWKQKMCRMTNYLLVVMLLGASIGHWNNFVEISMRS